MRFEVTVQELTQTFVFSEVQLPGTGDLYSAIEEAEGYRDETLQLKEEVEAFKEASENAANASTSASGIAVQAKDTTLQAKNDTLAAKTAVDQQAAIVATNTQTTTQKAQEASTSAQEALTSRNQAQGIKEDVESIAQEVNDDRLAVEQAKTSVDQSVIAVDADAQQVANDKAIIQQLTLENQALRAENQILTDLSRDYNTQSANNAIGALQVNIGGTNGIDNILPVAQLMPGMGLNGVNFLVARTGTGATNFNLRGILDRSLPNRPRFDFDPVTRRPLGVLVEDTVSIYSLNYTLTTDTNLGFNGTVTSFIENGNTYYRYVPTIDVNEKLAYTKNLGTGITLGQNLYVEIVARPRGNTSFIGSLIGTNGFVNYNILTGLFETANTTIVSSSAVLQPDGFWRIRYVARNNSVIPTFFRIYAANSTNRQGAELEFRSPIIASTQTSFVINNSGATLTRPADNLTQNISSWNQSEGTVVVHVRPNTKPHQSVFIASDGAPVQMVVNGDDLALNSLSQTGAGSLPVVTPKSGTDRFGNANSADRIFLSLNGGTTTSDQSQIAPNLNIAPFVAGRFRVSFWARSATGTNQIVRTRPFTGSDDQNITITPTWQLFSFERDLASTTGLGISIVWLRGTFTPNTADVFLSEISFRRISDELRLQADGTLTFTRSGVTQTLNLGGSLNNFSSYAISYAPNRVAACRNGGTVQEITTAGNINVTNISYAPDVVGASKHVFAQYFARAMSNLSMQGKTGDFKYGQEPGDFTLNQNLGELAFHNFQNLLAMGVADQTLRIRGTNALVTEVISRNYPFEVISLFTSLGGTITVQNITGIDSTLGYFPAGSVATLTFNATVGTVWDVAIRPRLTP